MSNYLPSWHRIKALKERYRVKATPGPYVVTATPEGRYEEHYAPPGRRPRRIGSWAPEHEQRARQEAEELNQRAAGPVPDDEELPGEAGKDLRPGGPFAHERYQAGFVVRRQGERSYHSYHHNEASARRAAAILNKIHRRISESGANPYGSEEDRREAYDHLLDQGSDEHTARYVSGWRGFPQAATPAQPAGKAIRTGTRVRTRGGSTGTVTGRDPDPAWSKNGERGYRVRLENIPLAPELEGTELPVRPNLVAPVRKKSLGHGACCTSCSEGGTCCTGTKSLDGSLRATVEERYGMISTALATLYQEAEVAKAVRQARGTKSLGDDTGEQIERQIEKLLAMQRALFDVACHPEHGVCKDASFCKEG